MMNSIYSLPLLKNENDLIILLKEYHDTKSAETQPNQEYFHTFYAPFDYAIKRIMNNIFTPSVIPTTVDINYFKKINDEILHQIKELCSNMLLTELNINRLSGSLRGETKEERYFYFENEILNSEESFLEILEVYPEMLSLIVLKINQILDEQLNMITNFEKDYNDIKQAFFQKDYIIKGYKFGMGDSHNNGKSVKIIETDIGNFVYKPKSMLLEVHFNTLLDWINSKGKDSVQYLKYPKVICKKGYGWQEYIYNDELESLESAHNFYYRQGMNIALMYILNAGDFHHENIIASGDFPVLIDVETFFSNVEPAEGDELSNSYQTSVLSTMMLPMDYGELLDFEISGLLGRGGQVSNLYSSLKLVNLNSDDMQLVEKPFVVSKKRNIPTFLGQTKEAVHHIHDIRKGFTYSYNIVRKFKLEFLELIDVFKNDTIRVVLRPTQTYGEFLSMSKYPKFLVGHNKRRELFQLLYQHQSKKFTLEIIDEEVRSLENDDIPYFCSEIGSNSIEINGLQIFNYFGVSPLTSAKEKVHFLNDNDLKLQVKIIDLSLKYELSKTDVDNKYINPENLLRINLHNHSEIKKNIDYWVEDILNKSTRLQSGRIQWFSHVTNRVQRVKLGYMLYGLYDGITGMAILFGLLSKFIDSEKYEFYYKLLISDITSNDEKVFEYENNICGFGNTGSIIYTYLYLGKLRNEEQLISRAVELSLKFSSKVIQIIEKEKVEIDFVSGLSSLLLILCRVNNERRTEKLSINIGIIVGYIIQELENQMKDQDYRTGFAHGYSGMIYALNLASLFTDVPNDFIERLLISENKKYDNETNKWYDTRENDNKYYEDYWCQGSVGIFYSRANINNDIPLNLLMLDELKKNSKKSIQHFTNLSLCHGYLGNFLILNYCSNLSEDFFYLPRSSDGYVGGLGEHKESIGLFLGEAGLVYFLISLLFPDIPNVLYLEA